MLGRRLTSISRARLLELVEGIEDGSLLGKWHDGKEAITRKEKVEARQLSALAVWVEQGGIQRIRELLEDDTWRELEFVANGDGVAIRLREVMPRFVRAACGRRLRWPM